MKVTKLILAQLCTILALLWLPWTVDGTDHFHGGFMHYWVWEYIEGVGGTHLNLPVLLCELSAIWLAYFMLKAQKPTT